MTCKAQNPSQLNPKATAVGSNGILKVFLNSGMSSKCCFINSFVVLVVAVRIFVAALRRWG